MEKTKEVKKQGNFENFVGSCFARLPGGGAGGIDKNAIKLWRKSVRAVA